MSVAFVLYYYCRTRGGCWRHELHVARSSARNIDCTGYSESFAGVRLIRRAA